MPAPTGHPAWGHPQPQAPAPPVSALSPAPGYPAAPPPSSPVYPVQSGGYAARPVQDQAVRGPRPLWVTVAVAAVTALVVAAGAFFALDRLTDDSSSSPTNAPRPASVATIGQNTAAGVPVDGSSVTQPDWERVAATVTNSVVAIEVSDGAGSGVIFTKDGDILTNNHVVQGAQDGTVSVTLSDGRVYQATIVGTDSTTDLAVVRLVNPPDDLSPAAFGDSSAVTVGQQVMVVGNPLGLQNTVTTGIVSAVNRPAVTMALSSNEDDVITNAIQVDAAVNPGNSGGPLFDGEGKVIGIASSIATLSSSNQQQSGSIGLGFAIPSNLAQNIASQLINNPDHTAQHAYLGVRLNDATVEADGVTRSGAKAVMVEAGTPAAAAGLQNGDVIVAFNSSPVQSSSSLTAFVRSYSSGDTVTLTIVRDGKALEVDVTLTSREQTQTTAPDPNATP